MLNIRVVEGIFKINDEINNGIIIMGLFFDPSRVILNHFDCITNVINKIKIKISLVAPDQNIVLILVL